MTRYCPLVLRPMPTQPCCWMWRANVPVRWFFGCAMAGTAPSFAERFAHLFEWRPEVGALSRVEPPSRFLCFLLLMTTVSFAEKIYKIGPGYRSAEGSGENRSRQYTDEAKAAKIEGTVGLTIVVGIDQRAHDIKVTKSLDPGLDASAIASIKAWRFQPGTKNGKPVPVRAKIEVNFRLL